MRRTLGVFTVALLAAGVARYCVGRSHRAGNADHSVRFVRNDRRWRVRWTDCGNECGNRLHLVLPRDQRVLHARSALDGGGRLVRGTCRRLGRPESGSDQHGHGMALHAVFPRHTERLRVRQYGAGSRGQRQRPADGYLVSRKRSERRRAGGQAQTWVNAAIAAATVGWSSPGNVSVLNLLNANGTKAQDQLYYKSVPEPGSLFLMSMGLVALVGARSRARKQLAV